MSDLVGFKISEGALVNMLAASQPAFARAAALIRAKLLSGTILQSHETGMRVGKQNWWAWVFLCLAASVASYPVDSGIEVSPGRDRASSLAQSWDGRAVGDDFFRDVRHRQRINRCPPSAPLRHRGVFT